MRQLQVSGGHCLCVLALTDSFKPTHSPNNNNTRAARAVHMCESVAAIHLLALPAARPC